MRRDDAEICGLVSSVSNSRLVPTEWLPLLKQGPFPNETTVFFVFSRQPLVAPIGEGFRNAEDDRRLSMRSRLADSKLYFLHSISLFLYFAKQSFSKVKTPLFQCTIDSDRGQCYILD
jgi:hypothetical protein